MENSYFGKKQYTDIIRLRAIENSKYLIKCSYNGNSYVISSKGKIIKYLHKGVNNVILPLNNKKTIYQKTISML